MPPWRPSRTNLEMVGNMIQDRFVRSANVGFAFRQVERANYVLNKDKAYSDSPESIKYGATMSAPHMHAHAAENLLPFLSPGSRVLDVGSGSGYMCAIFHHLVSPRTSATKGKVVGIEHIPELAQWSLENFDRDDLWPAVKAKQLEMVVGDCWKGYPQDAPYDAIHVGVAAPFLPQALVDQLASPGRMFIPLGADIQDILQVDKDENGHITQKRPFEEEVSTNSS